LTSIPVQAAAGDAPTAWRGRVLRLRHCAGLKNLKSGGGWSLRVGIR